jgi:hypothetical protein
VSLAYDSLAHASAAGAGTEVVPIVRAGVLAERWCRRGGPAEVGAVFERSFYLRAGDTFLCVGAPAIGNGPLTLIADVGDDGVRSLGVRVGQRAECGGRHMRVGSLVRLSLADCAPWRPPAWSGAAPRALIRETLRALARRAAIEAPVEGLARIAVAGSVPDTWFARAGAAQIANFRSWLAAFLNLAPEGRGRIARRRRAYRPCGEAREGEGALPTVPTRGEPPHPDPLPASGEREQRRRGNCDNPASAVVRGLIGLGPGLTPSGDDFLCGALALLDALGETQIRAVLSEAVNHAAPSLTSPLSACFLRAAADRHIGEYLHRAVDSLISGDADGAIAAAREVGHTSGWDMLAGAAITLRAMVHP